MFVKIEPSGCCVRKGLIQIRFCMYLDEGDYGYGDCHIQIPVIPESGYPGKVDKNGEPLNVKDYDEWFASLPTIWQDKPFHNHFIYVTSETSNDEIMNIGEAFLNEAYIKWAAGLVRDLKNPPSPFVLNTTNEQKTVCNNRLSSLLSNIEPLVRKLV